MRTSYGEDATRAWLEGMISNNAQAYSNNRAQLDAIAAGEVDFGLLNNYYLPPRLVEDPDYPVAQRFFGDGDIGNLANVTGIGMLQSSDNQEQAIEFISWLMSDDAQSYFTENYEYPITSTVAPNEQLVSDEEFQRATPDVDLRSIFDLPGTLRLLSEVGLLDRKVHHCGHGQRADVPAAALALVIPALLAGAPRLAPLLYLVLRAAEVDADIFPAAAAPHLQQL